VLSSWPQGHCESSLGSSDECRPAPSGHRPSDQATWLGLSPPICCYHLQPPAPFIITTQPESWYSFAVPRRVEGWVDPISEMTYTVSSGTLNPSIPSIPYLGTAGKVHTARAQDCKSQLFLRQTHSSIPGRHALQSGVLLLTTATCII